MILGRNLLSKTNFSRSMLSVHISHSHSLLLCIGIDVKYSSRTSLQQRQPGQPTERLLTLSRRCSALLYQANPTRNVRSHSGSHASVSTFFASDQGMKRVVQDEWLTRLWKRERTLHGRKLDDLRKEEEETKWISMT